MVRRLLAAGCLLIVAGWATPAQAAATGTVTGRYTTDAGAPIRAASVSVYSATDQYQGNASTDADGRYTVRNVTVATVKVKFSEGLRTQYAHRKPDLASATQFTVPDGGTLTVDEARTPDSTITGVFTTPGGEPIAGAQVTVYDAQQEYLTSRTTGPDGRYRTGPIPAGPVKLEFDHGGLKQWAHQAADFASATTFDAPADGTLTVDETQIPTGTIRGVISGLTEDLYVTAIPVGAGVRVDADVAADGHYSISVPAGQYRIQVVTEITDYQWVPQKTRLADGTVFTVATGQTLDVDETVLPLGAIGGHLSGGRDERVQVWSGDRVVVTGKAYDDSEYLLRAVPPGDYQVSFQNGAGTETWLPGVLDRRQAKTYTVRAYKLTTASTVTQTPATLTGHLTTPDGSPVPNFFVSATSVPPGRSYGALTKSDGSWTIDSLQPGDYVVDFARGQRDPTQWAYGATTAADAHVFTLTAGSTTTVDDTFTQGDTLRVTTVDAVTGEPTTHFCAELGGIAIRYCTDTDVLTIPGLTPGPTTVKVVPTTKSNYLRPEGSVPVTIGDQPAEVTVPLEIGGRINAQVVERATGKPAFDFCLSLATPGDGAPSGPSDNCTNRNGKVTTYAVPEGTYQVFVRSSRSLWLGAQWVGATGGTGNQKEALKIKVKNGKVAKLPLVQLDPGDEITGTVRDAAGEPVVGVGVSLGAWPLGGTPPSGQTYSGGRYTLYGLGPYEWPVLFTPKDGNPPRQFSGATGNRFQAATVVPGNVLDHTLVTGSRLTGTVTTDRPFTTGRITAVNAATGDILAIAGFTSADRTYDLPIIGGGTVLLRWTLTGPDAAGSWPDKVSVPTSGAKTVNLTITGS